MASKKKEKDFSGNKEQKNGSKFKLPDTLYGEYIRIGGNLTKNKRIDLLISEFEKLDDSEQMLVVALLPISSGAVYSIISVQRFEERIVPRFFWLLFLLQASL